MKRIIVGSFLLFAVAGTAMSQISSTKTTVLHEQTQKKHTGKKHAGKKHHHKHRHRKTVK